MATFPWLAVVTLFWVGACAGFLMHRSDFCMAAAVRDLFLFRSAALARSLALLVVASMIWFEVARQLDLLPYYPFPWFAPPAGVNLIGGLVFGIGMVLAGGCVVGVLYKFGGGSLAAGVAILGLVTGSGLYAEIHPWWSRWADRTLLLEGATTLPEWLDIAPGWVVTGLALAGGLVCWRWWHGGGFRARHAAEGYIPPWQTAIGLSLLVLVCVLMVGLPMGVTTTYAKMAAWLENGVAPDHVAGLSYFADTTIHYTLPGESLPRSGGAGPVVDVVAIVQAPLIVGIIFGAFWSARRLAEFRPRWRLPWEQAAMVFAGGVIMALGARMAPGCNIWHLMGGLPLLTMESMLFVVGLFPGAWLGSRLLQRIVS